MATITERYQALYLVVLGNLEVAMLTIGPNITVGGVSVDRVGYIAMLNKQLEDLEKKPGVAPEVKPIFNVVSVAR